MRILFYTSIPTPYNIDFIAGVEQFCKVKVLYISKSATNLSWDLSIPNNWVFVANRKKMREEVAAYNPDIVLIGGYVLPWIWSLFIYTRGALRFSWAERPIIKRRFLTSVVKSLYLKLFFSFHKGIFAIGLQALDFYSNYHRQCMNLPYSMGLKSFYDIERNNGSTKTVRFLSSGQFIDRKNHISLIKAMKLVPDEAISLTIIGEGEKYTELLREAADDNRIEICTFVQPSDLPEVYASHDVFVMPSKHDGWGLVIIEAMASGMPIIGNNNISAVHDLVIHDKSGYICSPTVKSISSGIEYYSTNKDHIYQHGVNSRGTVRRSLSDSDNAKKAFMEYLSQFTSVSFTQE